SRHGVVRARQIAVCGPAECTRAEWSTARSVGALLAAARAVVLCGGGSGVMAAAAAGARAAGGLVIGIRPGGDPDDADPSLSAVVATGMGEARNVVLVRSADAVIVIGGSWGTLSELALARRSGIPVVSMLSWSVVDADGHPLLDPVPRATSPEDAVRRALNPPR
ncbi:MAG TPA: TIGR00725 family protein, partial [Pseudonocardia sp.]